MDKKIMIFTMDADWASDDVLENAISIFRSYDIPVTLFMTHNTQVEIPNTFEVERHPNFCENSTHGNSIKEVVKTMRTIKGKNIGYRSHKYCDSNDIMDAMIKEGAIYSSNICTNLKKVDPFYNRNGLLCLPIFFEDGGYLKNNHPIVTQNILDKIDQNGIYIFNFHPMHIAFNTSEFKDMRELKDRMTLKEYSSITNKYFTENQFSKKGIRTILIELLEFTRNNNLECNTLEGIIDFYD